MNFKSLEEKCTYYRSLTDYKLIPNTYVMIMLDGRSFSHMIKNKFQKPFDDNFIEMMNETAKYLCNNIQGCKFAYVQSDEISMVITDFDTPTTDSFFGNRICKIQSIVASMATAKFNQLMALYNLQYCPHINPEETIKCMKLCEFDCKCWNVPTLNDVYAWFLCRQIDCIKNSKQQTAQTYFSHKELMGKDSESQIKLLLDKTGIDWNSFEDDKKYGRFIYKVNTEMTNENTGEMYQRKKWKTHSAYSLADKQGKDKFFSLDIIPNNN